MIDKEHLQRRKKYGGLKEIPINIKIDKETSKFLADNNISPTLLFEEAVRELKKNVK